MQHLLIPTDFSIKSLNVIHAFATKFAGEKVRISLFHLLQPENDITQLFRSRRSRHMDMVSQEFYEACQILQNRYGSVINRINIEFGFGTTAAYIANLMEGLKVDAVILSTATACTYNNRQSIDPVPLFKKAKIKIEMVQAGNAPAFKSERSLLNTLSVKELMIPKEEDYVVTK